jgi:hypothetical protein
MRYILAHVLCCITPVEDNEDWIQHVQELEEVETMGFPLVADNTGEISRMVRQSELLLYCLRTHTATVWAYRFRGFRGRSIGEEATVHDHADYRRKSMCADADYIPSHHGQEFLRSHSLPRISAADDEVSSMHAGELGIR